MKQFICILYLFFLSLPLQAQQEKVYTVDNLPNIHLIDKTQYVTDPTNILSRQARDTINNLLYRLEQETGIQSVVAVVPSIGYADCFEFSHELLNKWGVGQKDRNNGLIVLLVTDQRCIQFYNGYGLEGDLPDAISKRIQTQVMLPYLRSGDWNNAMVAGIKALYNRLSGSMENDDLGEDLPGAGAWISLIFLAILFMILFLGRGGNGGIGPFIGGMLTGGMLGRGGGSFGSGRGFGGGGSFGGGLGGGGGAGTRF